MKRNTFIKFLMSVALVCTYTTLMYSQQAFGKDNLAVLVAAIDENNTTVSVVEVNKTDADQTAVQTISIPGSGENAIRVSGSAGTTLYAANSADGTLFCFTGHKTEDASKNANRTLERAVIALGYDGTYAIKAEYTGVSRQQTRCATTFDNINFYIADQEGQYTNDAVEPSPAVNIRGIKIFGETVYVGQQSKKDVPLAPVATTSAITGGVITDLPLPDNMEHDSVANDFYMVSSGANGNKYDVLYIVGSFAYDNGSIRKYSLVNDGWNYNGVYLTDFGGARLSAEKAETGAYLYLTTGHGGTADNQLIKLVDVAGHNATIDIDLTQKVTLFSAPSGAVLKGVAFAPKSLSSGVNSPVVAGDFKFVNNKMIFGRMPSSPVEVFAITGAKMITYKPAEMIEVNLPKGIYIVRTSGTTAKIIVK